MGITHNIPGKSAVLIGDDPADFSHNKIGLGLVIKPFPKESFRADPILP
jgi:hypothetical protein